MLYLIMDTLELRLIPSPAAPTGIELREIEILINSTSLRELVSIVESKHIQSELDFRVAEGEIRSEMNLEPGDYSYQNLNGFTKTKDILLGKIRDGFKIEENDLDYDAQVLMDCTCGCSGCWPLIADIEEEGGVVSWSNLRQFHRPDWSYNLGPFKFDLEQYRDEIQRLVRTV